MRYFLILFFCVGNLFAYDTTFSQLFDDFYKENHRYEGDFCDELFVEIKALEGVYGRSLSSKELEQEGVDQDFLDALALHYCKKHEDAYLAIVWPTMSAIDEPLVFDVLSEECLVAYRKHFTLKNEGPLYLMKQIPEKIPHISFDFHRYFDPKKTSYPMMCFVVRAPNLETVVRAKRTLREILGIHPLPYCMHINDFHDQCLDLAHILLNNNSIDFLNRHKSTSFEVFAPLFEDYKRFVKATALPVRDFCVDGSCVLAAYGIRDTAVDFDFLCTKKDSFGEIHPMDHHNSAWEKLSFSVDEMIYNPKNHFYYQGYKFAALSKMRDFKAKQARANDLRDVALIEELTS